MAKFKVSIKPSAVKEIEKISNKKHRRQIVTRISGLANDPNPPASKKLSGHDRYRLRSGSYRILYEIFDDELIVVVVKVGDRKDVYR